MRIRRKSVLPRLTYLGGNAQAVEAGRYEGLREAVKRHPGISWCGQDAIDLKGWGGRGGHLRDAKGTT